MDHSRQGKIGGIVREPVVSRQRIRDMVSKAGGKHRIGDRSRSMDKLRSEPGARQKESKIRLVVGSSVVQAHRVMGIRKLKTSQRRPRVSVIPLKARGHQNLPRADCAGTHKNAPWRICARLLTSIACVHISAQTGTPMLNIGYYARSLGKSPLACPDRRRWYGLYGDTNVKGKNGDVDIGFMVVVLLKLRMVKLIWVIWWYHC